jgi:hypothetical protein
MQLLVMNRLRRAAELAEPLKLREAARAAVSEAVQSRSAAEEAEREANRWRTKGGGRGAEGRGG